MIGNKPKLVAFGEDVDVRMKWASNVKLCSSQAQRVDKTTFSVSKAKCCSVTQITRRCRVIIN